MIRTVMALTVTAGLVLTTSTALAEPVARPRSLTYPALKSPDSLAVKIQISNQSSKATSVRSWTASISGTGCEFGASGIFVNIEKMGSADLTQRKSCPWSSIAKADNCGPNKTECRVRLWGTVKYVNDGESGKATFNEKLKVKRPGISAAPAPRK